MSTNTKSQGENSKNEKTLKRKSAFSQAFPVMVTNIILVVFGMCVAYPTILIPSLSNPNSEDEIYLNQEQISWIGSINLLSLPLGCVLSGIIAQVIGRKLPLQITSVLTIVCWIAFKFCTEVWQIYAALTVSGFTTGLCESPVLSYVAEISQPHLRGSFLSSATLSITLGIFVTYLLGSVFTWRTIGLYANIPPCIYLALSFFIPESPYWLVVKNKFEEARKSLAYVRGWTNLTEIEEEFKEIVKNSELDENRGGFELKHYVKFQFVHPFVLISFLFLVYNLTGLYTIQTYAVKIFETLEVPLDEYDATVILGVVQFLGCLLCVLIVSYTGRRKLTFVALGVSSLCSIIVATYAYLTDIKYLYIPNEVSENFLSHHKWIPLLFILIGIFALNCGIRTLPWNFSVEVFITETRSVATGALGAVFYFISFGCNKAFLGVVAELTFPGVFWAYGGLSLASMAVLYFWLPETEGKSLDEIKKHFEKKVVETPKEKC